MRTLLMFGLGAAAMYLLDPQQGRRRRALLRDKFVHTQRLVRERTEATARDLSNRAQGVAAQARRAVRTQLEPDQPTETPESAKHLGR
jgi:hypothetical protein